MAGELTPPSEDVPAGNEPSGEKTNLLPELELAPREGLPLLQARGRQIDVWGWWIALGAIGLPLLVLLVTSSIPRDQVSLFALRQSVRRGDFLVPIMIMCVEAIRRWCREVECGSILRYVRLAAVFLCASSAVICLIALAFTASVGLTAESGRSISTITVGCFVAALVFGTAAVWASTRGDS